MTTAAAMTTAIETVVVATTTKTAAAAMATVTAIVMTAMVMVRAMAADVQLLRKLAKKHRQEKCESLKHWNVL